MLTIILLAAAADGGDVDALDLNNQIPTLAAELLSGQGRLAFTDARALAGLKKFNTIQFFKFKFKKNLFLKNRC